MVTVLLAFRAFDRQYIIPDARLLHRPSPAFWSTRSQSQIFTVEQHNEPISEGPALLFTAEVPDFHLFNGRGGRVLPLFRDAESTAPNILPGLLEFLEQALATSVGPEDFIAYVAAVASQPAFTARYAADLTKAGAIRVPLSKSSDLWQKAIRIGKQVIWLHTYGLRCAGPTRPPRPPRLPDGLRPKILSPLVGAVGEIPACGVPECGLGR
jgi:predicted helicase